VAILIVEQQPVVYYYIRAGNMFLSIFNKKQRKLGWSTSKKHRILFRAKSTVESYMKAYKGVIEETTETEGVIK
jgi:hypothetical protein